MKSEKYKEFIRSKPCCVCGWGEYAKCEPHHVYAGGMGMKCSDLKTIPLCTFHHSLLHSTGKKTFANMFNLNYEELIKRYNKGYNAICSAKKGT